MAIRVVRTCFCFFFLLIAGIEVSLCGESPDIVEVTATGRGLSKKEALSQAFSEAVRYVVGSLVSSSERISNDKYVEKISSYSDGYVSRYEVLSEENGLDGSVRVKINAFVVKGRIVAEINSFSEKKGFDGKALYSEIVTRQADDVDSQKILVNLFKASIYPLYRASLVSEKPSVVEYDNKKARLALDFKLVVDESKYFEVLKHQVEPVFSKLCVYKYEKPIEMKAILSTRKGICNYLDMGLLDCLKYDQKWSYDDVEIARKKIKEVAAIHKSDVVVVSVCSHIDREKGLFLYDIYVFDSRVVKDVFRKCYDQEVSMDVDLVGAGGVVLTSKTLLGSSMRFFGYYDSVFGNFVLSPAFLNGQAIDYELKYRKLIDVSLDRLPEIGGVKFEFERGDGL